MMIDRQRTTPGNGPGRATNGLRAGLRIVRGRVGRYAHAIARYRDLKATRHDSGPQVLIITNDLSRSGAPMLVFEMASLLVDDGYSPIVISPVNGPFAARLRAKGVRVLVDPLVNTAPTWLLKLADRMRWILCNTVDTADVAAALAPRRPTLWYLHEVSLLEERLANHEVRKAIDGVSLLWAGSALCADKLRPLRPNVAIVPYGVEPLGEPPAQAPARPLSVGVFGSIEWRKGQDLAVDAIALLSPGERQAISLTLYGRILDPGFAAPVLARARSLGVHYVGELDYDAYKVAIAGTSAVLVSSRDDTLPLVSIDALGLGRMLLLSPHVGTAAWLDDKVSVLVAPSNDAAGLAELFRSAIHRMGDVPAIGAAAREAFDRHFSRSAFLQRLREGYTALEQQR